MGPGTFTTGVDLTSSVVGFTKNAPIPGGVPLGPVHVNENAENPVISNCIGVIGERLQTLFGFASLPALTEIVGWSRTLIVPEYDMDAQAPPLVLIV